jgi:hypothetical protein
LTLEGCSVILFSVMRKYSVVNEEGVVEEFIQLVGDADHAALNAAIELAGRAGEDVVEHHADGSREVVWSFDGDEPWDGFNSDAEADGDALASAGFGTDEDYGCFDAGDEW